jgi:gamma-glutamyltranspeptidase
MNFGVKLRNFSSGLNIIHIDKNLYGGSDHRREGIAIGE